MIAELLWGHLSFVCVHRGDWWTGHHWADEPSLKLTGFDMCSDNLCHSGGLLAMTGL